MSLLSKHGAVVKLGFGLKTHVFPDLISVL